MSNDVQHSSSGTYRAVDLISDMGTEPTLEQVLTLVVINITSHPEDVVVNVANTDRIKMVEFGIASQDVAQVLGSEGRTVHALRTIAKAILGPLVKQFTYQISVTYEDRR